MNITIEPLKFLINAIFVLVTLPWGQFNLGDMTLSWIGNEFPPQLALICSGDPFPGLSEGIILIASDSIPDTSIFYRSIVLLLEYSPENGSRGLILNRDTCNDLSTNINYSNGQNVGYGGPVDKHNIAVIHDCRDLANESDFTCTSENIFVTEYDSARRTLSRLSSKALTLIKLYRVTAQRARQKLKACTSAASAYAHHAKNQIASSLKSAFSRTRRAVSRVSGSINFQLDNDRQYSASDGNHVTGSPPSTPIMCELCSRSVNEYSITAIQPSPCPLCVQQRILHGENYDSSADDDAENSPSVRTNIRVVKGYAHWNPCQLDGEIRESLWRSLPLRHKYIFSSKPGEQRWMNLYEEALKVAEASSSISEEKATKVEDNSVFFDDYDVTLRDFLCALSS